MARKSKLAALAVLILVVPALSSAADIVVFDDGRILEVANWEIRGSSTVLEMEGGGRIAIPSGRIVTIRPGPEVSVVENAPWDGVGKDEAWREWAGEYSEMIAAAAERFDLDPVLLTAVARVESNFDPFAVSHKGACGILQLMPATAERFGVQDVFDPEQNIMGGARYLRWLLDRFEGQTDLALAAYNAGEQVVERYSGIPPYTETREYVARVMSRAGMESSRRR